MSDTASDQSMSTVNLVRSSHPWTQADSAAGFVLRYLIPMRRQLVDLLGSPAAADDALKLLLGHLVSVGFGDQNHGRLRDYLVRAVRSASKTHLKSTAGEDSDAVRQLAQKLEQVTLESKTWLGYWRDGLLQRAWRSLERTEHGEPECPVYSVLSSATAGGDGPVDHAAVAAAASEALGRPIDAAEVQRTLPVAKTMFAQFIADEIADTLETPERQGVRDEIAALGLGRAFEGIQM